MSYGVNAPQGLQSYNSITGGSWVEKTNQYPIFASQDGLTTYATSLYDGDPIQFDQTALRYGNIAIWNPAFTVSSDAASSLFNGGPLLGAFRGVIYTDVTGKVQTQKYWIGGTPVLKGSQIWGIVADDPNTVFDIQISTDTIAGAAFNGIGRPFFPAVNGINPGGGVDTMIGALGSNFGMRIGIYALDGAPVGDGLFQNVVDNNGVPYGYANNPTTGNVFTGSGWYLDASTGLGAAGIPGDKDYNKRLATLPLKAVGIPYDLNVIPGGKTPQGNDFTLATTPFINVLVMINNHFYGHNAVGPTYIDN